MIKNKKYDLEERTASFAEKIIELCKKASQNAITIPIINQLIELGLLLEQTTMRQTEQAAREILKTKYLFVKKKLRRLNIGLGFYLRLVQN